MSDCCVNVLDTKFDARDAEQQARVYRRSGPARETQLLIDALREAGVDWFAPISGPGFTPQPRSRICCTDEASGFAPSPER